MQVYQVLRPFSGYVAGHQLNEDEFVTQRRINQLVANRYIGLVQPVVAPAITVQVEAEAEPIEQVEDEPVKGKGRRINAKQNHEG